MNTNEWRFKDSREIKKEINKSEVQRRTHAKALKTGSTDTDRGATNDLDSKSAFICAPLHNLSFELLLRWKQKVRIFFSVFHAISKSLVANIFLLVEFFLAFSLSVIWIHLLCSLKFQFTISSSSCTPLTYIKFMHIWVGDFMKRSERKLRKKRNAKSRCHGGRIFLFSHIQGCLKILSHDLQHEGLCFSATGISLGLTAALPLMRKIRFPFAQLYSRVCNMLEKFLPNSIRTESK